jgi:biotin carboxyl carrier protein
MSMEITAPMPGSIARVLKKVGDNVDAGEELFLMESMKMEIPIVAAEAGAVSNILVNEKQAVDVGDILAVLA